MLLNMKKMKPNRYDNLETGKCFRYCIGDNFNDNYIDFYYLGDSDNSIMIIKDKLSQDEPYILGDIIELGWTGFYLIPSPPNIEKFVKIFK